MKNRPFIALLLTAVLCLAMFAGCKQEESPATVPPVTAKVYMLTHINSGIISYSADEFQTSGSLELYSDGTAKLYYADQTAELLYEDGRMWSLDAEDVYHTYKLSGKVLVLEYYAETLTFLEK